MPYIYMCVRVCQWTRSALVQVMVWHPFDAGWLLEPCEQKNLNGILIKIQFHWKKNASENVFCQMRAFFSSMHAFYGCFFLAATCSPWLRGYFCQSYGGVGIKCWLNHFTKKKKKNWLPLDREALCLERKFFVCILIKVWLIFFPKGTKPEVIQCWNVDRDVGLHIDALVQKDVTPVR